MKSSKVLLAALLLTSPVFADQKVPATQPSSEWKWETTNTEDFSIDDDLCMGRFKSTKISKGPSVVHAKAPAAQPSRQVDDSHPNASPPATQPVTAAPTTQPSNDCNKVGAKNVLYDDARNNTPRETFAPANGRLRSK